MKFLLAAGIAIMVTAAWVPSRKDSWNLVVGGTIDGYLSPCGCTKPMSGGIRRRASVISGIRQSGATVVVESGRLVSGITRQEEIKAETLAELFAAETAVSLWGVTEQALGEGARASLDRLSQSAFIGAPVYGIPGQAEREGVLVGAVASAEPYAGLSELASSARRIAVIEGGREAAEGIAKADPKLLAVIYRLSGTPPAADQVGGVWLISAGDRGRYIQHLRFEGNAMVGQRRLDLGPEVSDDPHAKRLYENYQGRVVRENLLEKLPRGPKAGFFGSESCMPCHFDIVKSWEETAHAKALNTLEKDGHDRDPDCVSCHVVGLDAEDGFKSRKLTPALASVGCESCHGPSEEHMLGKGVPPWKAADACVKCHTSETSPGFDFTTYWAKVFHQRGENPVHKRAQPTVSPSPIAK